MSKLIPESLIRYAFPLFHNHPRLKRYWFSSYPEDENKTVKIYIIYIQFNTIAPQSYVFSLHISQDDSVFLCDKEDQEQILINKITTLIDAAYEALREENPFETMIYETLHNGKRE